jgi:hypothetical protein
MLCDQCSQVDVKLKNYMYFWDLHYKKIVLKIKIYLFILHTKKSRFMDWLHKVTTIVVLNNINYKTKKSKST